MPSLVFLNTSIAVQFVGVTCLSKHAGKPSYVGHTDWGGGSKKVIFHSELESMLLKNVISKFNL